MVALLPGCTAATGQFIYSLMTHVFHVGTWQDLSWRRLCPAARQPWMLLPREQDYVDITGFEMVFHRDRILVPPTTWPLCGLWTVVTSHLRRPCCRQNTHTHTHLTVVIVGGIMSACQSEWVVVFPSVCLCFTAASLKTQSGQSWNELYSIVNILQVH